MSHTKKIVLIGDQFITVNNSKEINIHDVQSVIIDENFNITEIIVGNEKIKLRRNHAI
jgi:hypothetical protein